MKELTFGPLDRLGVRVLVDPRGVTLAMTDYHGGPVHLTRDDLRDLGLVVPPREPRLPPSSALAWRFDAPRGEPWGSLPVDGMALDGYYVARVSGGLDIFLTSYRAQPLTVGPDRLRVLGLRVRRSPLRTGRRRTRRG
jgi:hypothetical protein